MIHKILLFVFIGFFSISIQAQHGNRSDNSTIAKTKSDENIENIKNAHIAYLANDLVKMKYHIYRSQKDGFRTKDFFYLLGVYAYLEKDYKKCKDYWYTAYRRDCWECKEYIEKVKKKEPLDSILKQTSQKFILKLKD